jgi:hypothetical protein
MFTQEINKETGQTELTFQAKLAGPISTNRLENSNGTGYYLTSVSFPNQHGEIVTRSAKIWEKNLQLANEQDGMVIGNEYRCTAQEGPDGRKWLTLSHLPGASMATDDDFGNAFEQTTAKNTMAVGNEVF